ncbi:MAG TPA: type II toxin-antitoxin system RelE/ParE family toxin [Caulobacteraceae bacterium]
MTHNVIFAPEARDDLRKLYLFIAERAGDARALAYVGRTGAYCRGFTDFPERGTRQDDLVPGLRIVGFERRVTIAFHTGPRAVTIDRILYGGRDLGSLFDNDQPGSQAPASSE